MIEDCQNDNMLISYQPLALIRFLFSKTPLEIKSAHGRRLPKLQLTNWLLGYYCF